MKVIVFGATGTIGTHLVDQALAKGYEVCAFCRDPSKIVRKSHSRLTVVEGDVFNSQNVQDAIKGQDVVIIALGSGKKRKSVVRSQGTKVIIEAMKVHGIGRLICQTTLGAGESKGNLNFFWKYIMFGWFLKKVFLDHEIQEEYVRNSGLDWTIVRPGAFTNGSMTGQYKHGFAPSNRSLKLKVSRADVANFLLKQLHTNEYLHRTPGLSY